MARANVTTDHDKIRKWAEARGGHPATVRDTEQDDEPGILRLDFAPADEGLEKISWDEFARVIGAAPGGIAAMVGGNNDQIVPP